MKHAFAISAYEKFQEVSVLVDILRHNWKNDYLIVVCSPHPEASTALADLEIDSLISLETIAYIPGDGMPSLTARVFHSMRASCAEAVRLGATSVTHLHSDSWPLSEERFERLLTRLETKSVLARGPGLGERGYLAPLGAISDMFLTMSSSWLIKSGFLELDPFDFPLDALNIHGLLSVILFANGGFSELDFFDDYQNQEVFPGVFKTIPAKVASYPSIFNRSWAFLHVHTSCYPEDLGRNLQASYLLEYQLVKGESIARFVDGVDSDQVRREIRERYLAAEAHLTRRNLSADDFGQELMAMEKEVQSGYFNGLQKGLRRRALEGGRSLVERIAFGSECEPRFRLSRELIFRNPVLVHYRREFAHLSEGSASKIWFLNEKDQLEKPLVDHSKTAGLSFKKKVFRSLQKNPAVLSVVHPIYRIGRLYLQQRPLSFINSTKAKLSSGSGISQDSERNFGAIISLTSFGARLQNVFVCLETLFNQSIKAQRIILWIAEEERDQVPEVLLGMKERGLEIKFCPDWRAYKKLIPTLMAGHDVPIVTADDDVFYPKDWLENLLLAYAEDKTAVHCHRSTILEFENSFSFAPYQRWRSGNEMAGKTDSLVFPTGVGGVLYPPNCFHEDITEVDAFMRLSPVNDDIWFKAMTLMAGVRCRQTTNYRNEFLALPKSQELALFHENVYSGVNDRQLEAVFNEYGLFAKFKS